jgi:hypothetical protein
VRDAESAARASLIRGTLIYGALFAATLAGIVWVVVNAASGAAYVTVALAGLIALLLGYYVLQHLLDLRAPAVEHVGPIMKKWSRADLIIAWQSYYIMVGRKIFQIQPEQYLHLEEGQRARVVHFPHTLRVITAERLREDS